MIWIDRIEVRVKPTLRSNSRWIIAQGDTLHDWPVYKPGLDDDRDEIDHKNN